MSYYESLEEQDSFQFTKNILFKNDAVFSALDLNLNGDVRSFKQIDANSDVSFPLHILLISYYVILCLVFQFSF